MRGAVDFLESHGVGRRHGCGDITALEFSGPLVDFAGKDRDLSFSYGFCNPCGDRGSAGKGSGRRTWIRYQVTPEAPIRLGRGMVTPVHAESSKSGEAQRGSSP